MFRKFLTYIVIPLVFTTFLSRSSGNFRYGAAPIPNCAANKSYFGYCADCVTQWECSQGEESFNSTCSDNEACLINSFYSTCREISDVPDCSCPESGTVQKPDPYDSQKYLVCIDGDRHIFECPDQQTYNQVTERCEEATTTTTPQNNCPKDENTKVNYNCTCYLYCFSDGTNSEACCPGGQIFSDETLLCVDFEIFTCEGKGDGRYVDYHNCSKYYTCLGGETFETLYCDQDSFYNVTGGGCQKGECGSVVEDCGICQDDKTFIKIDCLNYYDCVQNPEKGGQPYIPTAGQCPEGTCFDATTTFCEPDNPSYLSYFRQLIHV